MSSGNKVRFKGLDSLLGYGGIDIFDSDGGIVDLGFGEVRAKTRAVATASAYVLNSAIKWCQQSTTKVAAVERNGDPEYLNTLYCRN